MGMTVSQVLPDNFEPHSDFKLSYSLPAFADNYKALLQATIFFYTANPWNTKKEE